MEVQHVLNERLKRLEPTDTHCHFCDTAHSTNMNDNYFIPVFRENDRTNVLVYRSVKYQKLEIGIPRCKRCKNIHILTSGRAKIYTWVAAALVVFVCYLKWDLFWLLSIFPSLFIALLGRRFVENILVRKYHILTKRDGAERNATVQEFIITGWSFNQPTA